MSLKTYQKKRDFNNTPEPSDEGSLASKAQDQQRFVIQRHAASRLHYDLRLESRGVLKSWAIPKGPSMNPVDKRLAIMVEDHPIEYLTFEGIIPKGNYGAGTMEIWDQGYWYAEGEHDDKQIDQALKSGNLKFRLEGDKVKGGFDLVRIQDEKDNSWLFIKRKDKYAVNEPYNSEDHQDGQKKIIDKIKQMIPALPPKGKTGFKYEFQPMLAKVKEEPFDHPEWLFEIKWDGYRTMAEIQDGKAGLFSRKGLKVGRKYPVIIEELEKLKYNAVVDGELVVLDEEGHANFQDLQYYGEKKDKNLCYYIFDLLYLEGYHLLNVPLKKRKELLKEILPPSNNLLFSDHITEHGKDFFEILQNKNLEGMIAKKADSSYQIGKRSPDWLKIKMVKTQEAVICGFTEPKGSRKHMGSLVLGLYDHGNITFIGHSGGGFSEQALKDALVKLKPLIRDESPFHEEVKTNTPVTWVEPELVCELSYTDWTKEGSLRHPKFLGFRPDKDPREVIQETETPDVQDILDPQNKNHDSKEISIEGIPLSFSNLNKLYWPEEGYTKGDLIAYYDAVAEYILPYLKNRPESLHRHPDGIKQKGFFQKDMRNPLPDWLQTTRIYSESADKVIHYLLCQNKATLLYMANLGCIEINPWNSRIHSLNHPDYIVIDIDPDGNSFEQITDTALTVKQVLDEAGLKGYCKTSGSSGLHIFIPLDARYEDAQARSFSHIIAQLTHERLPDFTSMERSPKKRKNKIYLDYLQNKTGQTLAATYSVRPKPGATVSTPLTWEELEEGVHPSMFTIKTVPKRLETVGDLFKGVLGQASDIEKALSRLQ
ncbi:MAG: DNA ligase D [Balneolales bacterium]